MKRSLLFLLSLVFILASLSGCGEENLPNNSADGTTSTTTLTDAQPVLTVNEEIWERTFCKEGLEHLLENYTVTNLLAEGQWDTCVTPSRVSRLAKNNADELMAGAILANGQDGVIQYVFRTETGWTQGTYDETDTVEEYVKEITQGLAETLQALSGEFENASWDEEQSAYVIDIEIPYNGPALADPSQEQSTVLTFEVFFADERLTKVNVIDGESRSVVHSFGTTPIPQLPDA